MQGFNLPATCFKPLTATGAKVGKFGSASAPLRLISLHSNS